MNESAEDAAIERAETDREYRRTEEETSPASDPRSKYGDPADWHYPRGPYYPRD